MQIFARLRKCVLLLVSPCLMVLLRRLLAHTAAAAAPFDLPAAAAAGLQQLLVEFGRVLARMHDGGVVHGALSSSCVLVTHIDQAMVRDTVESSNSSSGSQQQLCQHIPWRHISKASSQQHDCTQRQPCNSQLHVAVQAMA